MYALASRRKKALSQCFICRRKVPVLFPPFEAIDKEDEREDEWDDTLTDIWNKVIFVYEIGGQLGESNIVNLSNVEASFKLMNSRKTSLHSSCASRRKPELAAFRHARARERTMPRVRRSIRQTTNRRPGMCGGALVAALGGGWWWWAHA